MGLCVLAALVLFGPAAEPSAAWLAVAAGGLSYVEFIVCLLRKAACRASVLDPDRTDRIGGMLVFHRSVVVQCLGSPRPGPGWPGPIPSPRIVRYHHRSHVPGALVPEHADHGPGPAQTLGAADGAGGSGPGVQLCRRLPLDVAAHGTPDATQLSFLAMRGSQAWWGQARGGDDLGDAQDSQHPEHRRAFSMWA